MITARYLAAYHEDMKVLGVAPPDIEPRVTESLPQIVALIEQLVAAGHAYEAEGHVLFAVPSFAEYGELSGRDPEELLAGARVEVAPYKRDPGDFVLWKPSPAGVVGWPSPWGRGRPGWHIECSAMVEHHLGETIDIHGGGVDLVFPHHENEVAQSRCAHGGKQYARYWLHNGLVHVDGEKMSKSLGNFLLVRDALGEYGGETVRLALLKTHYRQPLDWTQALVVEARQNLDRLYGALREAGIRGAQTRLTGSEVPPACARGARGRPEYAAGRSPSCSASRAPRTARPTPAERRKLAESLRAGGWLLGLLQADPAAWLAARRRRVARTSRLTPVEQREAFRRERNFARPIGFATPPERGTVIEDVPDGSADWSASGVPTSHGNGDR